MNIIGKSALELTRSETPDEIRAEAFWWTRADGTRGTRIYYDGEEHGIHWWRAGQSRFHLRSRPKLMDDYDVQKLEQWMSRYYEQQHEQMVDDRTDNVFSYQDYEVTR